MGKSLVNEITLNCFKPSTETTLFVQQLFLVNCNFKSVFTAKSQQDFAFEKTATSTILEPQE